MVSFEHPGLSCSKNHKLYDIASQRFIYSNTHKIKCINIFSEQMREAFASSSHFFQHKNGIVSEYNMFEKLHIS